MKIYTIHHPAGTPDGMLRDPESTVLVKEGFSWPAFFIPALWLIYKRMWIVLVLYIAASILVAVLLGIYHIPEYPGVLVALALNLAMGLEGNELLRWTLARRGLDMVATVVGRDMGEAEHRAFEAAVEGAGPAMAAPAPADGRRPAPPSVPRHPRFADTPDNGLFPEPGRPA